MLFESRDSKDIFMFVSLTLSWFQFCCSFGCSLNRYTQRNQRQSWPKLSHNCLFRDLLTCVRNFVFLFVLMPETPGQRRLRLTKLRLTTELRQRTENRVSELREQSGNRDTDIEHKATQCTDQAPCIIACLFCFWLLVANLLFIQWLYINGRLKLD